jgi:hypothetical protein
VFVCLASLSLFLGSAFFFLASPPALRVFLRLFRILTPPAVLYTYTDTPIIYIDRAAVLSHPQIVFKEKADDSFVSSARRRRRCRPAPLPFRSLSVDFRPMGRNCTNKSTTRQTRKEKEGEGGCHALPRGRGRYVTSYAKRVGLGLERRAAPLLPPPLADCSSRPSREKRGAAGEGPKGKKRGRTAPAPPAQRADTLIIKKPARERGERGRSAGRFRSLSLSQHRVARAPSRANRANEEKKSSLLLLPPLNLLTASSP